MGRSDRVTGPLQAVTSRQGRYRLLVLAENAVGTVHTLPDFGSVTIGRGKDNTIQIDDESISRRHAVLYVGQVLAIEDKGSSNGTKVRDAIVEPDKPREVAVNELITLGSVTLIVQARFAPAQIARLATQDYFQTRVEEECARCERTGGQFTVIGLRVANQSESTITETLMRTLRQSDVLARFDENMYALLALDSTREQAEQVANRMVLALRQTGATASAHAAHFPTDARSAFSLFRTISGEVEEGDGNDIVIEEESMRDLYALAKRISTSDLSVLILGETGVGKEKMSRFVHDSSARAGKPFLAINCAALNHALLESELFGHERGAFTGAAAAKPGLLESADGGTVFLDEIGDMSLSIQAKLLRVLEAREVRRVGGLKSTAIDVRFVAATNVDLEAAVAADKFREDLYFRLSAATLVIPPLRERPREIEILARRFATGAASRMGRMRIDFTPDALELLRSYSWPGNIRELRNVIERAVVLCNDDVISAEQLPVEKIRGTYTRSSSQRISTLMFQAEGTDEDERTRILKALEQAEGNQSKAASILGVSRRTLINRLEQYNLPRPRKNPKTEP
ncbi:MAG: sigma 54-interacting transcriptional regulator [Kofleriaceae bacterium]